MFFQENALAPGRRLGLVAGDVGALGFAVAFGAMSTLEGSVSRRVFLSLSGVGGLGAGGGEEHCRSGGQPKIRAGQFHATKVAPGCQTNNRNFVSYPFNRGPSPHSTLDYQAFFTHLHLITPYFFFSPDSCSTAITEWFLSPSHKQAIALPTPHGYPHRKAL